MTAPHTMSRRRLLALLGGSAAATMNAGTTLRGAPLPENNATSTSDDAPNPPSLDTRLTREYGVRFPFVSAGMGFVSYTPLLTAVSNAGGIGVLGNGVGPPPST